MIVEVAICTDNLPDNTAGGERAKEGDIVATRPPGSRIGTKEGKLFLWLRLDDLTYEQYVLAQVLEEDGVRYDKRRFCIPLSRLEQLDSNFSPSRTRDQDDMYQPYLTVDEETYEFVSIGSAFQAQGLVYDKVTQSYL